jgi:hypothetical protein
MTAFALLGILAFGLAGAAPATTPSAPAAARPETLTATVRAVDGHARTLDLLIAVGHAMRVRRIHVPAGLNVRAGATETPLTSLAVGSIVRVGCRYGPGGTRADAIELLQGPGTRKP